MTPLHTLAAVLTTAHTAHPGTPGARTVARSAELSLVSAGAVCPVAPGDAQQYVDEITGYILWGVLALFTIGMLIGIGAILAGRIFGMPHASKAGVVSIVIIFVAGIGYLVLPGMINGFMGTGCITSAPPPPTGDVAPATLLLQPDGLSPHGLLSDGPGLV